MGLVERHKYEYNYNRRNITVLFAGGGHMAQNQSLSTQEVADILHVSKSTIYDLIRRGEIHS